MASLKVAFVMLLSIAVMAAPITSAAITCNKTNRDVEYCLAFLRGDWPLSIACCTAVRGLLSAARTPHDKQAACNCLTSIVAKLPKLNETNAAALPRRCGVNIHYKISTSTNCATIKF